MFSIESNFTSFEWGRKTDAGKRVVFTVYSSGWYLIPNASIGK
jgi:hypothetical protein